MLSGQLVACFVTVLAYHNIVETPFFFSPKICIEMKSNFQKQSILPTRSASQNWVWVGKLRENMSQQHWLNKINFVNRQGVTWISWITSIWDLYIFVCFNFSWIEPIASKAPSFSAFIYQPKGPINWKRKYQLIVVAFTSPKLWWVCLVFV